MTTSDQLRLEASNPWLNPENAPPLAPEARPAGAPPRIEVYRLPDELPETFSLRAFFAEIFSR